MVHIPSIPKKQGDIPAGAGGKASSKGWSEEEREVDISDPKIQKAIIAVGISLFVGLVLFTSNIIKEINSDVLSAVVIFWNGAPNYWGVLTTIFSLITMGFVGLVVWNARTPISALFIGIGFMIFLGIIVGTYPLISSYIEDSGMEDYLRTMDLYLDCTIGNIGKNPEDWKDCYVPVQPEEEEEEPGKMGSYEVLDIRFDRESETNIYLKDDEGGNAQPDFRAFELDLYVTNPGEKTVKNFYIVEHEENEYYEEDTAIIRDDVREKYKIKLANLYEKYGRCTEDHKCDIEPGETERLILRAEKVECPEIEEEIKCDHFEYLCEWEEPEEEGGIGRCVNDSDSQTDAVKASVEFFYDYSAEGKHDLIIASTEQVLEELEESRSENINKGLTNYKTGGPVDVNVYFIPSSYLFQGLEIDGTKPEINLKIQLSKDDKSSRAYLQDYITIVRPEDGVLDPGRCTSWSEEEGYVEMEEEGDTEKFAVSEDWPLVESQTYLCSYTIDSFCRGGNNEFGCGDLKEIKECEEHPCCSWDGECEKTSCEEIPAIYGEYGSSCELCCSSDPEGIVHVSESNGEYMPFIVRVDYRYRDSIAMSHIKAEELEQ